MRVVFCHFLSDWKLLLIKHMRTKLNSLFIILLISCNFILTMKVETSKGKGKDMNDEKAKKENPYYLFTVGFVEIFGGKTTQINKCVPTEWLGDSNQKSNTSLENFWEELISNFKSILTLSPQISTAVCAAKSDFKTFVIGDKKSLAQKNKSQEISDFYSKANEQYEKVKKSFISLVGDKNFHIIMDILRCGTGTGLWNGEMASSVAGITKKVGNIEAGLAAGGVGVEAPIADIFINIVCNLKLFALSISSLIMAFQKDDKHNKWDSFGRFFASVAKIDALDGKQIVLRKATLI
jgi:hypothetical protein